jgi:hypothetical protein
MTARGDNRTQRGESFTHPTCEHRPPSISHDVANTTTSLTVLLTRHGNDTRCCSDRPRAQLG